MRKFLSFLFLSAIVCFNVQTVSADPIAIDKDNPYVNNFDTESTNALPTGWTELGNGTGTVESKSDVTTRGGSAKAFKLAANRGKEYVAILPEFSDDIAYLTVSFYPCKGSNNATYSVGYVKDGAYTAKQSFTASTSYSSQVSYSFEEAGAPAGALIAIQVKSTENSGSKKSSLYIDDVTVTTSNSGEEETCAAPKNFRCTEHGLGWAKFAWEQGGDETEYESGLTSKGGEVSVWTICMGPEREYKIVDLPANMELDFYLRSICPGSAEGDRSKAVKCSLKTDPVPAPTGLKVDEVSTTGAKLSWTAAEGISAYEYQINDGEWTKIEATELTLNDLKANTAYTVKVRSWFDILSQSEAISASFRTECAPIAALPWSENFEDFEAGAPLCWTLLNAHSDSKSNYPYIAVAAESSYYKDTKALFFRSNDATGYAILPEITADLSKVQISFSHKSEKDYYGKSGSLVLGYITNVSDAASFVAIKALDATNQWINETAIAIPALPAGARLAFQYTGQSYYYDAAVDDILIDLAPACAIPTELKVSEVTDKSAKLNWTSDAIAWVVEFAENAEFSASETKNATEVPFVMSGLDAQTTYYVRVKANCGTDGESAWSEAQSFTTECAAETMPYEENFATAVPSCWKTPAGSWSINEEHLRLSGTASGELTTQAIILSDDEPTLLFNIKNSYRDASGSQNYRTGRVIVSAEGLEDLTTEFIQSDDIKNEQAIDLKSFKGKTIVITVKVDGAGRTNYYADFDNFRVVEKPCAAPTELKAEPISETSVRVYWTGEAEKYNFQYREAEGEWSAEEALTDTTKTLTELSAEKSYEFRVQAVCSATRKSAFATSAAFAPACPTPQNVALSEKKFNSVVVSWVAGGSENAWKVTVGDRAAVDVTEPTYKAENLVAGTEYTILVQAACGGEGAEVKYTPVLTAPVLSAASAINDKGATFAWKHAVGDNAGFQYVVVTKDAEPAWGAAKKTDETTITIEDLEVEQAYAFYVRAIYGDNLFSEADHVAFETVTVKPGTPVLAAVGQSSAKLNWAYEGAAVKFEYALDTTEVLVWKETEAKEVVLSGLQANTAYTFFVRAKYSDELKTDSVWVKFQTTCEVAALPFAEDFSEARTIPSCWSADNNWKINASDACVYFNAGAWPSVEGALITPIIGIDEKAVLSFRYKKDENSGKFDVVVMKAGDLEGDTLLEDLPVAKEWTLQEVNIPAAYVGENVVIAFLGHSTGKDKYVYVDDVRVEAQPSCAKPATIAVTKVLPNGAKIEWTAGNGENQFQYRVDDDAWTLLDANVFAVELTTYAPGASHEVYVRAYCSESEQSAEVKVAFEAFCPAPTALEVSEISKNSAKLSWTAAEGISVYEYQLNEGEWIKVEAMSVTLSDLKANTAYSAVVRSHFSDEIRSAATKAVQFRTNCDEIASLPWLEDFNDQIDGASPACWDLVNSDGEGNGTIKISQGHSFLSLETPALSFEGNNSNPAAYAILPEITADLSKAQLTFAHKADDNSKSIEIALGYFVGDAFTAIKAIQPGKDFETTNPIALSSVPANGRLAFRFTINTEATYKFYCAIDDILIEAAPDCAIPTDLTVSNVSDKGATLRWESGAALFRVELSKNEDMSDSSVWEAEATELELSDLDAETTYYVRVIAICDETHESAPSKVVSFTTECGAVEMPYSENFDEIDGIPACWKAEGAWSLSEGMLRFNAKSYNAGVLTLPLVNVSAADAVLIFRYRNSFSDGQGFIRSFVTIIGSDGNVVNEELANASEMTKVQLDLSAFNGKAAQITFQIGVQSSSTAYFLLDDVQVVPQPCEQPKDLQAEAGNESVILTWAAGEDESAWQLRYKQTEAAEWTVATVGEGDEVSTLLTEKMLKLAGLENDKEYEAQVRAYCDEQHQSEWTASVLFTPTHSTGIDAINSQEQIIKRIENGVLYIIRDGFMYNAQGARVY